MSERPPAAPEVAPPWEDQQVPVRAEVRVVIALRQEEEARLQATLAEIAGRPVELLVRQDPSILGGVWVRMGDMVIDGSIKARLKALDEQLCAHCRLLLMSGDGATGESA